MSESPTPRLTFSASGHSQHRLCVETGDPLTEAFVVDGQFQLVARGLGRVEAVLPAGSYLVKFRAGEARAEQWVHLDRDVDLDFDRPPVAPASSAPLTEDEGWTRAELEEAADLCAAGSLAIVVRDPKRETLGADRVSLLSLDGRPLVKLSDREPAGDGWRVVHDSAVIGFAGAVDPGAYRLRVQSPAVGTYEMALWVGPLSETTVYLTRKSVGRPGQKRRVPHLESASVLIAGRGQGVEDRLRYARLTETARAWLARERPPIPDDAEVRAALSGDGACPMFGLVAAHLMSQAMLADGDEGFRPKLEGVLDRLDALLPGCPDVGAVRLTLGQGHERDYGAPPMLRTSWRLINAEERGRLVPPASLAAAIGPAVAQVFPWLVWDTSKMVRAGGAEDVDLRNVKALKRKAGKGPTSHRIAQLVQATDLSTVHNVEDLAQQWRIPVASVAPAINELEAALKKEPRGSG